MDMEIVAKNTTDEIETTGSVALIKNGKPTAQLITLAALELSFDVLVGYGVYKLLKLIKK